MKRSQSIGVRIIAHARPVMSPLCPICRRCVKSGLLQRVLLTAPGGKDTLAFPAAGLVSSAQTSPAHPEPTALMRNP
jgi:hypothetical protein